MLFNDSRFISSNKTKPVFEKEVCKSGKDSFKHSVYVHQRKPRTNRVIRQVLDNVTLVIISCLVSLPMFVIIKPLNTVTVVFVRLLEECL